MPGCCQLPIAKSEYVERKPDQMLLGFIGWILGLVMCGHRGVLGTWIGA